MNKNNISKSFLEEKNKLEKERITTTKITTTKELPKEEVCKEKTVVPELDLKSANDILQYLIHNRTNESKQETNKNLTYAELRQMYG